MPRGSGRRLRRGPRGAVAAGAGFSRDGGGGREGGRGGASGGDQGGLWRRARFLLVGGAEGGGRAEAARADRFAAMRRALLLGALLPLPAFAYNGGVPAFIPRHALPLDRPVAPPTQ